MVKKMSKHPRKQRKMLYNAPIHKRRKMITAILSEDLREQYGRKNIPVKRGDVVKIMRGNYKGFVGKVVEVDYKRMKIAIEGVTIRKVDGKSVQRWIHPSNVMITRLELSDERRRKILERGGE